MLMFAVALLAVTADSRAQEQPASAGSVNAITIDCPDADVKKSAEDFFAPLLGQPLSRTAVSDKLKRFYFRGPISSIRVSRVEGPKGNELQITIEVNPLISSVEVEGNESIGDEDVVDHLDVRLGDRLVPAQIERLRERFQAYYVYRGFPKAKAEVSVRSEERARSGSLHLKVQEGPPCKISQIELGTDRPGAMSQGEIQDLMDINRGDRCDGEAIRNGVRRIEKELRNSGRLSAVVADPVVDYSESQAEGKLTVSVQPGPVIRVLFRGNTFAFERDSVLRKEIGLDSERQFSRSWAESAAKESILDFYRRLGYPNASVEISEETNEEKDSRSIQFLVSRGSTVQLGNVTFRGNRTISSKELETYFEGTAPEQTARNRFVESELQDSWSALAAYYRSRGYLRAKILPPRVTPHSNHRTMDVLFEIEEGEPSTLGAYRIEGNHLFDNREVEGAMSVQPGDPINMDDLSRSAQRLEAKYRSRGYKFASVQLPPIEEIPEGAVTLPVKIQEGPMVHFGAVAIRGNATTREKVIARELRFKEGDPYDPDRIADSRRNIVRLGFFQRVTIEELEFDSAQGREDVLITVVERKKRVVTLRPGFSTDDGARLAGTASYINIGGTGRSTAVSGRVNRQIKNADITEHQVIVTYREPRIFRLVDGRVNFIEERSEEQQFDIERQSVILAIERQVRQWFRGTLQWELEFRDPFDVDPTATLSPFDEDRARFGSIATIFDFDRRDDLLNPRNGSFHTLKFSVFHDALLSEADFYQAFLSNSFYRPVYRKVRLVVALRLGFSGTFGATSEQGITEIPIEKRFRLGGNNSLRGFSRNCVGGLSTDVPENCSDQALEQAPGGNSLFNYMADLLIPLGKGIDLAVFTDGGNAFLGNGDFDITNVRSTAGFGLRYNTFFGPLRLDYGIKLDRRTGENFGEFHFAVGQL